MIKIVAEHNRNMGILTTKRYYIQNVNGTINPCILHYITNWVLSFNLISS